MATVIGLLTSAFFVFLTLNIVPDINISVPWQFGTVFFVGGINSFIWYHIPTPPMRFREAAKVLSICALALAGCAVVDTIIGFIGGHAHTIPAAFMNSGGFGGVLDLILLFTGLVIGIPTLVRALCIHQFAQARKGKQS